MDSQLNDEILQLLTDYQRTLDPQSEVAEPELLKILTIKQKLRKLSDTTTLSITKERLTADTAGTPSVLRAAAVVSSPANTKVNFRGTNLWWNRNDDSFEGSLSLPKDCDISGNPTWDKVGAALGPGQIYTASAYGQTYRDGRILLMGSSFPANVTELVEGWQ